MTLTDIIKAAAERMESVTVEVDEAFGTVAISAPGEDDIFMQGENADAFIDQARQLWDEAQTVTMAEVYAYLAEPYAENIWN